MPTGPCPPRRPRRRQFTIFGLMVLMFVVSLAFSQLYYWRQAELRWEKQKQEQLEREKQAAQAMKEAGKNGNSATVPTAATSVPVRPTGNSGDAAIAILMAVALPMLVMIIASIAYNLRKFLRRRRSVAKLANRSERPY